ncbi:sialin-like isoform X2 [Scylla paramamosain]|uniref:sialin-like isoform X2 n=1 Tax=Scylla paramamosain TaxID=85552 RepID=UPI0030834C58
MDAGRKQVFQQEGCQGQVDSAESKLGKRHDLILLLFLGFAGLYAMRVNLSVAIVAMVRARPESQSLRDTEDVCPNPEVASESKHNPLKVESRGEFDWDEQTQGMVLGGFFYGYLLTNYLGGRLADRFGGRLIYGAGVTLTAFLTIISPSAARYSTNAFILVRVLEGMTEGVTYPATNVMISHWIPPQERARSISRSCGGTLIGTVITLSVSGWLTETEWGWPSVFYLSGFICLVWSWFWFRYAYDTPDDHPTISAAEKHYIRQSIGHHRGKMGQNVPWRSILTSVPFMTLVVAHVCHNWGFYCLLTELPTYLRNIQHFNMKQNGLISALPYMVMWVFNLTYSSYMDHLLETGKLSTKNIRKISMIIANHIPAAVLLLVPWVGCDRQRAVILICIALGSGGASTCGLHCGFQELAPNFAGTLTGISNTVATIPGFLAPAVTGMIINNQQTLSSWREVFHVVSLIYIFGGTIYLIFMSADTQPWNDANTEKRKGPFKETTVLKNV